MNNFFFETKVGRLQKKKQTNTMSEETKNR